MVLSDNDIKTAIEKGNIQFSPMPDLSLALGSCSIDLRLGDTFRVFEHSKYPYIDTRDKRFAHDVTREIHVAAGEPIILQPADFILATTVERFSLPSDLLARLEGRSSLGRLGIVVHSTASIFEPGWDGKVVMEMGNMGRLPVALYPGMRVCALTFEELSSPARVPYNKKATAKYAGQTEPIPSKIAHELETPAPKV